MRTVQRILRSMWAGAASLAVTACGTLVAIVQSRTFWIATCGCLFFWLCAKLIPKDYLFDTANSFVVCVGVGVLISYIPGLVRSLWENKRTAGEILVMGIVLMQLPTVTRHLYNWVWRYFGKPEAMIDHEIVAFMVFLTAVGGILQLSAAHAIDERIPETSWRQLGIVSAFSLAVAFFFILYFEPLRRPPLSQPSSNILEAIPIEDRAFHIPAPDPPPVAPPIISPDPP